MKKKILFIFIIAVGIIIGASSLYKIDGPLRVRGWIKSFGDIYPGWDQKYTLGKDTISGQAWWWDSSFIHHGMFENIVVDSGICGTVDKANSLINNGSYIYGDNFLRSDTMDTAVCVNDTIILFNRGAYWEYEAGFYVKNDTLMAIAGFSDIDCGVYGYSSQNIGGCFVSPAYPFIASLRNNSPLTDTIAIFGTADFTGFGYIPYIKSVVDSFGSYVIDSGIAIYKDSIRFLEDTFSLYASNDTFFIDAKHDAGYLDLSELTVLFKPGWMEFDQIKPATNDSSSSSIGWSDNPYGTGYFIDLYVDSIHGFSPVKICDKTIIQHESATSDTALIITLDTISGGGSVEHTGIKMNGTAFSISQYFLKFYDRDDNLKFFVRGDGKLYSGNDIVSNSFFAYNNIEVQDDCKFGSDSTDTVGIYGDLTVQGELKPQYIIVDLLRYTDILSISKNAYGTAKFDVPIAYTSCDSFYVDSILIGATFQADSNEFDKFQMKTWYNYKTGLSETVVIDSSNNWGSGNGGGYDYHTYIIGKKIPSPILWSYRTYYYGTKMANSSDIYVRKSLMFGYFCD
ncbi:MAG TPA: hypothetical protein ENI52_01330 [Thermoplasmata archaeon]|nr:hypothetical protein [Thermoplasmata archaeon]